MPLRPKGGVMKTPVRVRPRHLPVAGAAGPLVIESSHGGEWTVVMAGLTQDDVDKQFARLKAHGAVIEEAA